MSELKEYKCPSCSMPIKFNIGTQNLKCSYCDTEVDINSLIDYENDKKEDKDIEVSFKVEEKAEFTSEDVDAYICNSCGAGIMLDKNSVSIICPFCDSTMVVPSKISGSLKPDYLIPFKIDKEEAKKIFKKFVGDKPFIPKIFKENTHIEEIKALYVPYWLFNATSKAKARFRVIRGREYPDRDKIYREENHYLVKGSGELRFENIAFDASKKMEDRLMQNIEPFDFKDAIEFNSGYLSGFLADRYDVPITEFENLVNKKIKTITEQTLKSKLTTYDSIYTEYMNVNLEDTSSKYVLYPVWILNTKYKDKRYVFLMNAQNGKFAGDLPVDNKKVAKSFFKYALGFFVLVYIVLNIINFF